MRSWEVVLISWDEYVDLWLDERVVRGFKLRIKCKEMLGVMETNLFVFENTDKELPKNKVQSDDLDNK